MLKKGGQSCETKPEAAKWAAAGPSVHAGGHARLFGLRSFQPWPQAVPQRKQASWRKFCRLRKAEKAETPGEAKHPGTLGFSEDKGRRGHFQNGRTQCSYTGQSQAEPALRMPHSFLMGGPSRNKQVY